MQQKNNCNQAVSYHVNELELNLTEMVKELAIFAHEWLLTL